MTQYSAIWKDIEAAVQGRPIQSVAGDKDTFGTLILNPKSSFTLDLWFQDGETTQAGKGNLNIEMVYF